MQLTSASKKEEGNDFGPVYFHFAPFTKSPLTGRTVVRTGAYEMGQAVA